MSLLLVVLCLPPKPSGPSVPQPGASSSSHSRGGPQTPEAQAERLLCAPGMAAGRVTLPRRTQGPRSGPRALGGPFQEASGSLLLMAGLCSPGLCFSL